MNPLVKHLVLHVKVDVLAKDRDLNNALHYAACCGRQEILEFLLTTQLQEQVCVQACSTDLFVSSPHAVASGGSSKPCW